MRNSAFIYKSELLTIKKKKFLSINLFTFSVEFRSSAILLVELYVKISFKIVTSFAKLILFAKLKICSWNYKNFIKKLNFSIGVRKEYNFDILINKNVIRLKIVDRTENELKLSVCGTTSNNDIRGKYKPGYLYVCSRAKFSQRNSQTNLWTRFEGGRIIISGARISKKIKTKKIIEHFDKAVNGIELAFNHINEENFFDKTFY